MAQNFIYNDQKVSIGDTVSIHQEIIGGKKRVQVFEGLVIAIKIVVSVSHLLFARLLLAVLGRKSSPWFCQVSKDRGKTYR